MNRKKIELEKGGIKPVAHGLWVDATQKLQEAEHAIALMETATDRFAFEIGWGRFVDSLEQFWVRFFDEGKVTFSNFQPWAGKIDAKRKSDPLLKYLFQARHQSQHGRIALQWEAPKLSIGQGFSGHLYGLKIFKDGTYDASPHQPGGSFPLVHSPGKPMLPVVVNRKHDQTFNPPTGHDGQPLTDRSPIAAAKIALGYYGGILVDAMQKFAPTP